MGGTSLFNARLAAGPILAEPLKLRAPAAGGLVATVYRVVDQRLVLPDDLVALFTRLAPTRRPLLARRPSGMTRLKSPTGRNSCACSRGRTATSAGRPTR